MDQDFKLKPPSSGKIMWISFINFYTEWCNTFGRPRSWIPSFLSKSWEAALGTTREISSTCLERFRAGINIANKRADKVGEVVCRASERTGRNNWAAAFFAGSAPRPTVRLWVMRSPPRPPHRSPSLLSSLFARSTSPRPSRTLIETSSLSIVPLA